MVMSIMKQACSAPEDVVVELVVAGHSNKAALTSTEGEEDLHRSVTPYLQNQNYVTLLITSVPSPSWHNLK